MHQMLTCGHANCSSCHKTLCSNGFSQYIDIIVSHFCQVEKIKRAILGKDISVFNKD